jgi:hypothetical protein
MFLGWEREILEILNCSTIVGCMKLAVAPELMREVKLSA